MEPMRMDSLVTTLASASSRAAMATALPGRASVPHTARLSLSLLNLATVVALSQTRTTAIRGCACTPAATVIAQTPHANDARLVSHIDKV